MTPVARRSRPRPPRVRLGRTAIVVQAVCAVAFLAYLLSHEGVRLPFASHTFEIKAEFADATGLDTRSHSQVTVAGVPLGRVENVSYSGGWAVATLSLDSSAEGEIHRGATARIIPRSALQDLTVDIDPGSPEGPALAQGATIPPVRTSSTPGADELVGVLDADTRSQVQVLLSELAVGLRGRSSALRADVAELGHVVDSSSVVTRELARRRALLTRFVGDLDTIFKRLRGRNGELADAVTLARRTLETSGNRAPELAATIQGLPSTLDDVSGALAAVRRLAAPLDPALERLQPFASDLPGSLDALARFVPKGQSLIAHVSSLVRRGNGPLRDLSSAMTRLGPASEGLRSPIARMLPLLRAVDKHREGIGQLGDRFSGVFSTSDRNGPILRGLGFFEPFNPQDLGFDSSSKADRSRAELEAAKALRRVCLQQNAVACLARYLVPSLPGSVADHGAKPIRHAP